MATSEIVVRADTADLAVHIQLLAAIARMNAEREGMVAENQRRLSLGESVAYDGRAFFELAHEHGLTPEQITETLRGPAHNEGT